MSLRIRWPNGNVAVYNDAVDTSRVIDGVICLLNNKGNWLAQISPGADLVIEATPPCRVFNSLNDPDGKYIESILRDVQAMKRKLTKLSTAERRARKVTP